MFDELSKAIAKLIKDKNITGPQGVVEVSFDRPSEPYPKHDSAAMVNAFLYDVREDTTLRSNELSLTRANGEVGVARAPFYVTCSYLMTVWVHPGGQTADDSFLEQSILGQLMAMLAGQPEIPVPLAQGIPWPLMAIMAVSPLLIPASISTVDEKGSLSEFWTAVGNKIRPSFVLKATVPLEAAYPGKTKIPAATSLSVAIGGVEELHPTRSKRYVIGGKVTDDKGEPRQRATVEIVELRRQTETNSQGGWVFSNVPEAEYTIRVAPIKGEVQFAPQSVQVHVPRLENDRYDFTVTATQN
jgi:hypothetical protein